MKPGSIQHFFSKSTLVLFSLVFIFASHSTVSQDSSFITANQGTDGKISLESDVSTSEQSTLQSILTLQKLDSSADILASARESMPSPDSNSSTEYVSLWLSSRALPASITETVSQLLERQNADGGFGFWADYGSEPISTGFALTALADQGLINLQSARNAVNYLISSQGDDGSWSVPAGNLNNVETTSIAANSLWRYRKIYDVLGAVDRSVVYLESQRDTSLWATLESSALALEMILNRLTDRTPYIEALSDFSGLQTSNGSFDGDVYLTALALRVLNAESEPPPDAIAFNGLVVDSEFGQPVSDAVVTINGVTSFNLVTDSNGEFYLVGIPPGAYTFSLSKNGFSSVQLNVTLQEGARADLGTLQLTKLLVDPETGEPVVTGILRGGITSQINGAAISGARVEITGQGLSAITDSEGQYSLSGIDAGSVAINVSASGFSGVSASAAIAEQQTLIFSPALKEIENPEVQISGIITERSSGLAVSGAIVEIISSTGTSTATTTGTGGYTINDLPPGDLIINVAAEGYYAVGVSTLASEGANLNFSPKLDFLTEDQQSSLAGIVGTVVDQVTGRGVEGVLVNITYVDFSEEFEVVSGADGQVLFSDIATGSAILTVSKESYETKQGTLDVQPGLVQDLGNIELTPSDAAPSGIAVGRVVDVRTGAPIAGAIVTADAASSAVLRSEMTDADGVFSMSSLPADSYIISISKTDYSSSNFSIIVSVGAKLDLGSIKLREPGIDALLPDLAILSIDSDTLMYDQKDFGLSGVLTGQIVNRGNVKVDTSFNIIAFEDTDNNGSYDDSDNLVGTAEIVFDETDNFPVDSQASFSVSVGGALSFYQAPVVVQIDSANVIAELSESNNFSGTARICQGSAGPTVDLALCMDSSGSVSSSDFLLQLEGAAVAVEDENIVPRDGSVRLSAMQFSSSTLVELPPTIIEEDNAQDVADALRAIAKSGGGTSIHSCINTATDLIAGLIPESVLQVIDVSTDGQSPLSSAITASNYAISQGIDALNSIGVGSGIDVNLLNSIVFPQPVGGDRGFVITVSGFAEYVDALSTKIERETKAIDLTVGQLALIDNGFDAAATATVVIGNAGAGNISEVVIVRVYNGDPDAGAELVAEVQYDQGFNSGDFDTVTIDGIDPSLLTSGELTVVAEIEGGFSECSQANNQQTISVLSTVGDIILTLNDALFGINTDVALTSTIKNTGALSGNYDVVIEINDTEGTPVFIFSTQALESLLSNQESQLNDVWNTSLTLAGQYIAVANLFDLNGVLLDSSSQPFVISELDNGVIASIRSSTDRPVYNVDDEVSLEILTQNLSQVTPLDDPSITVLVTNSNGEIVYQDTIDPASMAPGQTLTFERVATLTQGQLGIYQVLATLNNGSDVLAQSPTTFEVVNDPRATVRGEVVVGIPNVLKGEQQTCQFNTQNLGTVEIEGLSLTQRLVNIDFQENEIDSSRVVSIPAGGADQNTDVFSTTSLTSGIYACVLEAEIGGEKIVLASGQFSVTGQDIEFSTSISTPVDPQILVLVDDIVGEEPNGLDQTVLEDQLVTVSSVLDNLDVSYTVRSSADDFSTQLNTGDFNQYLLLSENDSLTTNTIRELDQSLLIGNGVITTSAIILQSPDLSKSAGLDMSDTNLSSNSLNFESDTFSDLLNPLDFPLLDLLNTFHLNGAQLDAGYELSSGQWQYEDNGVCRVSNTAPAMLSNIRGSGTFLTSGFDLALMAANDSEWEAVLERAVSVTKSTSNEVLIGTLIPISLEINSSTGGSGRIRFTPPENSQFVMPDTWVVLDSGDWQYTFTLASEGSTGEDFSILFSELGAYTIEFFIEQGNEENYQTVNTINKDFVVAQIPTLTEIQDELLLLVSEYSRDPWLKLATENINRAKTLLNNGELSFAQNNIETAIDWLERSDNDVIAVRQMLSKRYLKLVRQSL